MYPTFYIPWIGTAWLIGIIGTVHVLASHTSVGAALLFALLETRAYVENKSQLLDFIRQWGMFLLVFSYVIGSITGPGIWYSITIGSPRGVGGLIHNFVWVWAAEWVYFTVEVIGVYALVYLIGKVDAKTHFKLTWSFACASWATMLLIVGILSFMTWPGDDSWYQTGSTADAFYNLNFFAHLGVRTGSMLVLAALVGFIVATRAVDDELRDETIRFLAPVGLCGGLFGVMMFLYYLQTLPTNAMVMLNAHLLPVYGKSMIVVFAVITTYLAVAWWKPGGNFPGFGDHDFCIRCDLWRVARRTDARVYAKPFVAGQYIYGNQVIARDVPGKGIHSEVQTIAEKGLLKVHPFIPSRLRTVTDRYRLEVGQLLSKIACSKCHALEPGAPLRALPDKFYRATDEDLIAAFFAGPSQARHPAVHASY